MLLRTLPSLDGEVEKTEDGWTEARVKFLDSSEEEENEIYEKLIQSKVKTTTQNKHIRFSDE